MGAPWGEKRPSQQSPPSVPAGTSAAAPGHTGESCPHPTAFAPSLALVPGGKGLLFHSQRFTALHQDRDLTLQFSHICHVASAYDSFSHPQSPCADSSTGHYSPRRTSLATSLFWVPGVLWTPVSGGKGSRAGHRESGIPAFGVGLVEELPGEHGAVRRSVGWWEGLRALRPKERAH